MMPRLLLVDDDASRGDMLCRVLGRDHDCTLARSADEALRALAKGAWEAAVVDYDLGQAGTGMLVLQAVRLVSERTFRVLYSSYYSGALAQDVERLAGAHAVLDARRGEFVLELNAALARLRPGGAAGDLPASGADGAAPWCASAFASLRMLDELRQAAAEDTPVFVHGEEGSGKHLAATTLQRWRRERGESGTVAAGAARSPQVRVVHVPPLRERREDLAGLSERFLAGIAQSTGRPRRVLGADALADLEKRVWWGNVRELHAALYRAACAAGDEPTIRAGDLPRDIVPPASAMQTAKHEGMLQAALLHLRTAGSIRAAAALAGEARPNYKRRLNQLGVLRADIACEPEEPAEE